MARSRSQSDSIAAYARDQSPELHAICDKLKREIERALPGATSKLWHGSPVWFVGENPVVGYSVRQQNVDLMFWSGQLFGEPLLKPVGKDKAAHISFVRDSDISLLELRRLLKKAGTILFDYSAAYAQKRAAAKKKSSKRA